MFIQIQGPSKTTWKKLMLLGCATGLLGVFAIVAPISMAHVFMMLIGALICSIGITNFVSRLRKNSTDSMRFDSTGFASAILALVGALIMLAPDGASSFVVGIIALCLLLLGGLFFIICVVTRCGIVALLSSSLIWIAGAIFFVNRDTGVVYFMAICGLSFMAIGASLIAAAFSLKKRLELLETMQTDFESNIPDIMQEFFRQAQGGSTYHSTQQHPNNSSNHGSNTDLAQIFGLKDKHDDVIEVENLADQQDDKHS